MQKIQKLQLNTNKSSINPLIKVVLFGVVLLSGLGFVLNNTFAQEIENTKYSNLEREIINQLNQERIENRLTALEFNSVLRDAAKIKAKDLVENKYFSHTSPEGIKAWDILADVGYDYKFAGENLAMKFEDAVSVHNAWMKSKSHRENILFKDYTEVAVAIDERADGSLVAVEFFGKPVKGIISEQNSNNTGLIDKEILGEIKQSGERNLYKGKTGNLLTQVVPTKKRIEGKDFKGIIPEGLSPDQIMSLNNMILLVIGIVALISVVNIWVLEKEDERSIAEAKRLYEVGQVLVNN